MVKTKPWDRNEFLTTRRLKLLYWFEYWYGDGCPFWTWPVTLMGTLGILFLIAKLLFG